MNFPEINIPLLLAVVAFLTLCLLTMGIFIHIRETRYRRSLKEKIRQTDKDWTTAESGAASLTAPEEESFFLKSISAVGEKANPGRSADDADIKLKFLRAGFRGRNGPTVFWGFKFLLAVGLPMAFLAIAFLFYKDMKSMEITWAAIFGSLTGLYLPDLWLKFKTMRRREKLVKGFPDALDLLVVCVEAGMGLDGAIHRVGEEMALSHPELSHEFKSMNRELRAGKARQAALKNLAARSDIEDVNSLVTVLVQTDRFGTSVAQALRVFSDSFRTARYQRAEEAAAKIATKLIFPLVLCIFPAMFTVILGPVGITIYRTMINPS